MRAPIFLLVMCLASPCAAQPGEDAPPESVRCFDRERVLPSGVYWEHVGWYELHLACPRPAVAVVSASSTREPVLTRATAEARAMELAPGYPWVVHGRYAGLDTEGVAVVLGLFADRADAERWMSTRRLRAQLIDVLPTDAALARFHVDHGGTRREPIPEVTHVTSPSEVDAYDADTLRHVEAAWDDTYVDDADAHRAAYQRERAARLARARPVCRVAPDRVFVVAPSSRATAFLGLGLRAWQPARCGRRAAWISSEATQTGGVAWTDARGAHHVTQVTLVECDVATQTTWLVDEQRRRSRPTGARGGC